MEATWNVSQEVNYQDNAIKGSDSLDPTLLLSEAPQSVATPASL